MHSILLTSMFILMAFFAQKAEITNGPEYVISGQVEVIDTDSEIILSSYDPISQSKTALATTKMNAEGRYALTYTFKHPDLFRVDFPGRQYVMLAIDHGQSNILLNVEGKSGGSVDIKGSTDSQKLLGYENFRMESNARLVTPTYKAMSEAAESGDGKQEAEAVAAYVKNSKLHRQELFDYTKENIGTSIALYGTILRWTEVEDFSELESLVRQFERGHSDLPMATIMVEKMERYKKVALGAIAPDLTAMDQFENPVTMKESLGKYTLIDFWASWCGPCIRQLPDLHEAYDTFHDLGFEIVSVSVDNKLDKWQGAIDKYKMNWKHMSDVKGWASPLAAEYNVTFVPFNFLVDEEGKIIAKNIHSVTLQERLRNLLKS